MLHSDLFFLKCFIHLLLQLHQILTKVALNILFLNWWSLKLL